MCARAISMTRDSSCIFAELKTNGFDVQYFESLLDQLTKVKFEYTKHLEEKTAIEAQKMGAISSLSRNKSLLCEIGEAMAVLDQKLSKLNVVESSVKKALDDKRQVQSR